MIIVIIFIATHLSQKKVREVPPYREPPPGPASPPLRTLPPYRDPPPPNLNSPGRPQFVSGTNTGSPHVPKEDQQPSSSNSIKLKRNLIQVLCTIIMLNIIIYIRLFAVFNTLLLQEFQDTKMPTQSVNSLPAMAQNMATVAYTQRYVELIKLVNKQRDTINAQQADLTKVRCYIFFRN
jgi:Ras association domain-containing protein 7/8